MTDSSSLSMHACVACRASKLGCDKSRPRCMRCLRMGRQCSYAPQRQLQHGSSEVARRTRRMRKPEEANSTGDPKNSATRTPQRRNRVPNACARCRHSKLKCDREQPCGRCLKSNRGHDCQYVADPPMVKPEREKKLVPLYKQAYHSGFHWSVLVENIESLLKHHRWAGIHHSHPEQEKLFSSMENFLGSSPLSNATRRTLLSYMPPRDVAEMFIRHYLEVIEPSHQILHLPSFRAELAAFWDRPSTMDDGWLALFFVVLALGCQLHNPAQPTTQDDDFQALPSRLFDAAQALLQRTPFMIRPDLTSVRTLCLFVIYRQTRGAVCIEFTALWPVTGLIVRLAITLGLHLTDSTQYAQRGADDTTSRNRLWAAVILLDLRQALAAGMPVIPPSSNLLTEPLLGIGPDLAGGSQQKEFLFPLVIYNYLPQIFKILELATSPQITLSYSLVVKYDQQIKGLLNHFHNAFLAACAENPNTDPFQWTMTNIFIRRILLTLHSQLYQEPSVIARYPVSYWSSLECSLAILCAQRDLWDTDTHTDTVDKSFPPGRAPVIARLLQQDFFLAAITVCFHLVQAESPLSSPEDSQGCQVRARNTILELLGSCRDIWEREQDVSVCHGTAFSMIDSLLRIVESTEVAEETECKGLAPGCTLDGEECGGFCLGDLGKTHGSINPLQLLA